VQQEKVDKSFTQSYKGLVMYNKDHGITTISHHVILEHFAILKLYQMRCSIATTQSNAPPIAKKRKKLHVASISDFFKNGTPYIYKNKP
jgi:hypothetical protein